MIAMIFHVPSIVSMIVTGIPRDNRSIGLRLSVGICGDNASLRKDCRLTVDANKFETCQQKLNGTRLRKKKLREHILNGWFDVSWETCNNPLTRPSSAAALRSWLDSQLGASPRLRGSGLCALCAWICGKEYLARTWHCMMLWLHGSCAQ